MVDTSLSSMPEETIVQPPTIRIKRLARSLGYNLTIVKRAIASGNVPTTKAGKNEPAVFVADIPRIEGLILADPEVQAEHKVAEQRSSWKARIRDNVRVNIRDRASAPYQTILFVGPTNSGKTYHGLQELCADYEQNPEETHVYCGPLRLLAYEVYQKLVAKYGEDKVGFITGEEAINPTAKLLACTVEMAPEEGNSVLVDEAHWLTDSDRGHVWSKVLVGGKYKNLYVITAAEAVPLIQKLTEDSHHQEMRTFTRKTPLNFGGKIQLSKIPPKTAVVCFSRKSVYVVARELEKLGKKVGVLYGALPLKVRKQQIEDYLAGVYDIMVTTDVIGHGINLPIDNVVFTQTNKFDGTEIRPLYIWETAQIAGRAGRFGLSEEGKVFVANGLPWFNADASLVKQGALGAEGKIATDLYIEKASIAPRLIDLGIKDLEPKEALMSLMPSLIAWQQEAEHLLTGRTLQAAPLSTVIANTYEVLEVLTTPLTPWNKDDLYLHHSEKALQQVAKIDITEIWQLISGPFDVRNNVIQKLAIWLKKKDRDKSDYLSKFYATRISNYLRFTTNKQRSFDAEDIETLEGIVACLGEIKMGFTMFGTTRNETLYLGNLSLQEVLDDEDIANTAIMQILKNSIKKSTFGKCNVCGKHTLPQFQYCDECYQMNRRNNQYNTYHDDDYLDDLDNLDDLFEEMNYS